MNWHRGCQEELVLPKCSSILNLGTLIHMSKIAIAKVGL